MGVLRRVLIVLVATLSWYTATRLNKTPPLPALDADPWWGVGEPRDQRVSVRPFKIEIPKKDVDDLKLRLDLPARITPSMDGTNFTYGVNSAAMGVILKYWKDNYDWAKREKKLNTFKHYKTRIAGLDIHFMRASPTATSGKVVRPLLMVHGWPGSVVEFYDILPLLTSPRPDSDVVFDVICPSIPGYGFSEASARPGLHTLAVGQIFVQLMERLGYKEFYAQGGDWGSAITTDIATAFPDRLLGLHLNMEMSGGMWANIKIMFGSVLPSGWVMDPKLEHVWYPLSTLYGTLLREMGYAHIQATKPDTVGVALNSSPQGLAAYIIEKFSSWTVMENIYKKDGGLLDPDFPIKLDSILDNICIYWFTGSITTSMRFYKEYFSPDAPSLTMNQISTSVPTGIAAFPNELLVSPRNIAAHKFTNIVTYTNAGDAGHFAAMEKPSLVADDVHHFVNVVEGIRKAKEARETAKSGKTTKGKN